MPAKMPDREAWSARLPDRAVLKGEVAAMVGAIRDVVLRELGAQVRGLYHKGSGKKAWDTAIDYVPEISDVDVHVWLHDGGAAEALRDVEAALRVQSAIEWAYHHAVPTPVHVPRPQVIFLNRLLEDDRYVPTPAAGVEVVHGEAYPALGAKLDAEVRCLDAQQLIAWHEEVRDFGLSAMDKPGKYAHHAVRRLSYRVSPVGARVLTVLGVAPATAWAMNRSGIARQLEARGQPEVAAAIRDYYLAGWDAFLGDFQDPELARTMIRRGLDAVRLGAEVSRRRFPE